MKELLKNKFGYGYQSKICEILKIEKGHLNRVLNGKVTLTDRLEKQIMELCND